MNKIIINFVLILTVAKINAQTLNEVYTTPAMGMSMSGAYLFSPYAPSLSYGAAETGLLFDQNYTNYFELNQPLSTQPTTTIIFDTQQSILLKKLGFVRYVNNGSAIWSNSVIELSSATSPLGPWSIIGNLQYVGQSADFVNWFFEVQNPKVARYWKVTIPYNLTGARRLTDIRLFELQLINSTNNLPLNNGDCTTLTAAAGGETYLWSTGETTQSITVCNSGTYTCQVTNTSFTGNQDHTASIAVSTLGNQDHWPGPNGEVYSIHRTGNTVYYGGNFTEVGPITGSGAVIDESTAVANTTLPRINGTVNVTIPDGNGGWYVGGLFTKIGNSNISNLAHILSNNTVDMAFNPAPNNAINSLVLSGANLYIGGSFTTIQGISNNYLAKIEKATGVPLLWNAFCNNIVRTIQLYSDKIIVGGDFTSIGGFNRNYLAALDSNYVQATSWNPNPNAAVYKTFVNGNKLYVGGDFTNISGVTKGRGAGYSLPAFTIDGYDFGANNRIHDFAFNNNVLYACGNFTQIGGASRNYLAGLNYLNMIANAFNANADGIVRSVLTYNGNLYVGGDFANIGGAVRSRLASLNFTSGTANTWNPKVMGLLGSTYTVQALAAYNGQIYTGGTFYSVGSSTRNNVAAIDAVTGNLLPFDVNANNIVRSIVSNSNHVYIGGDFTTVNGSILKNRIVQVNATTGIATGWNPNADGTIQSLALSGNNLFVGGSFNNIGGAARVKVATLSTTTGAAGTFNPAPNGNVNALFISGDTLVLAGGFTTIGGQTRNRVALYTVSNSTLLAANPNANDTVNAVCLKGNKLYVGGKFSQLNNNVIFGLGEYDLSTNTTTSLNTSMNNFGRVYSLSKVDSSLYIGGGVSYPNSGQAINNAASIKTQSNLLGYWMPQPDNIVRSIYVANDRVYLGADLKKYKVGINRFLQQRMYLFLLWHRPKSHQQLQIHLAKMIA